MLMDSDIVFERVAERKEMHGAGTTMNYFLDDRINRAEVLFPGVGCFLIAVWLGAWLHKSNSADNLAKLQTHSK